MAQDIPVITPYLGEIRIFGGNFPPQGFELCDGKLLNITNFPGLFSLIGTRYGGDGISTFALPDLEGRIPIHIGPGYDLGTKGGQESITLSEGELPAHTHIVNADTAGGELNPRGNFWGQADKDAYAQAPGGLAMNRGSITTYGKGNGHENRIPYLVVNYIIAVTGDYPSTE